jgi:uridine phosphorylase
VYQSYDATAVRQMLGISKVDTPQALILHGTYNMPEKAAAWSDRLANARLAPRAFNVLVGEHAGRTLWYAPVLGAPMAAFVLHGACVLGVQRIIQIGTFGATRRGMQIGDLLLVTAAGRGEAASDWYLEPSVPACADAGLCEAIRGMLRERELAWHEGAVFTTPAFMAERWEDILRWEAEGYAGVEMEAATTLAVAQAFGVPAACLLVLLDALIDGRDLNRISADERRLLRERQGLLGDLALEIAATL